MLSMKHRFVAAAIFAVVLFLPAMVTTASALPFAAAGRAVPVERATTPDLLVQVANRAARRIIRPRHVAGPGHYRQAPRRVAAHPARRVANHPVRRYATHPVRRGSAYRHARAWAHPYRRFGYNCGAGYYCRGPWFGVAVGAPYYGYGYGYRYRYRGGLSYYYGYGGDPYYDTADYAAGDTGYGGDAGSAHVEWCLARYRSYDPRLDTYMGYDGHRHLCVSPYSG